MLRRRAVLGAALWPGLARAAVPEFSFSLRNGAGQVVTPAQFRGRYLLVFFGYTRCPDICPATLYRLAQAMSAVDPGGESFAAVFITLDPAHDSPQTVSRYAALFSPRIEGLSGSAAQVSAAVAAFHVYARWPQGPAGPLRHSALIYVLGPQGGLAGVLPDGESMAALRQALGRYHASRAAQAAP